MFKNSTIFLLYFMFAVSFGYLIYLNVYFPLNSIRSQQMYLNVGSRMNSQPPLAQDLVEKLKQAIELNPNNCNPQELLAANYGSIAFDSKIDVGVIKNKEAYSNTINTLRGIIQRCPDAMPNALRARYLLGYVYYYAGNFNDAIREAEQLINKYPSGSQNTQLSDAYQLLANIYEKKNDNEHRLVALIRSIYSNPDLNKVQESLATINSLINSDKKLGKMFVANKTLGFGRFPTAAISNGVIHLIGMQENSPVLISFTLEHNEWSETKVLLVKDGAVGSVAIDHDENIHAVYVVNNTIFYIVNPDNIESTPLSTDLIEWCKRCQIPGIGVGITSIQIREDSQSNSNLIWSFPAGVGLAYSKFLDGKLSTPELFAPYGENADFVLDNADDVHVVYDVSEGDIFPAPSTHVWYRERINGQWREPIQISAKSIWAGGATINIAQDGTIRIVYISGSSIEDAKLIYVYRNLDGEWSNPQIIADKELRPWIPKNYGGRYTVAAKVLADNTFALVWRVPKDENSTYLVGRKLDQSGWSVPVVITEIPGQGYSDMPSIVQESQPYPKNLKLIWSNAGKIKYFEWRP